MMNHAENDSPTRGRQLTFGPVSLLIHGGDVRYVRVGSCEVLRRIYVAVRDAAWGTIPGTLSDYSLRRGADRFWLRYRCEHSEGHIQFRWEGAVDGVFEITGGRLDCTITFTMDGQALSTFKTNRTGMCVLHPIRESAGRSFDVQHSGGQEERRRFPELIDPEVVVTDIAALSYSPSSGLSAHLRFEGEVFEMEDQRNWADTSFKTYCRPLAWGIPYELRTGQRIWQRVWFRIWGEHPLEGQQIPTVKPGKVAVRVPSIGLRIADDRMPTAGQLDKLRELHLGHLRADLHMNQPGALSVLRSAVMQAQALEAPLELAVHLAQPAELEAKRLAEWLGQEHPRIARCLVYRIGRPTTPPEEILAMRRVLAMPGVPIGGGTMGNFAEINRAREIADAADVLAWGISPQVHSTDDLSLIENLAAQADAVRTARSFAGKALLAGSPVVLHRRPDPPTAGQARETEPEAIDPRQSTALAAAWTLGSIKYLAEGGADSVTIHETIGPGGVVNYGGGDSGAAVPAHEVLKAIGEFANGHVVECASSNPLSVESLLLRDGKRSRLIIANMTPRPLELRIEDGGSAGNVLRLSAFEVRKVDSEE